LQRFLRDRGHQFSRLVVDHAPRQIDAIFRIGSVRLEQQPIVAAHVAMKPDAVIQTGDEQMRPRQRDRMSRQRRAREQIVRHERQYLSLPSRIIHFFGACRAHPVMPLRLVPYLQKALHARNPQLDRIVPFQQRSILASIGRLQRGKIILVDSRFRLEGDRTGAIMAKPRHGRAIGTIHCEQQLLALPRLHPARRKAPPVPRSIDLIIDRFTIDARPQEIAVQRMHDPSGHRAIGRHQRLCDNLPAEQRPIDIALVVAVAEQIRRNLVHFQQSRNVVAPCLVMDGRIISPHRRPFLGWISHRYRQPLNDMLAN
jgi:hypothetical protein